MHIHKPEEWTPDVSVPGGVAGVQWSEQNLWPSGMFLSPGSAEPPASSASPPGQAAASPAATMPAAASGHQTTEKKEILTLH